MECVTKNTTECTSIQYSHAIKEHFINKLRDSHGITASNSITGASVHQSTCYVCPVKKSVMHFSEFIPRVKWHTIVNKHLHENLTACMRTL